MKTASSTIWNYQFIDAKKAIWSIPLFHLIALFVLISIGEWSFRIIVNGLTLMLFAMVLLILQFDKKWQINSLLLVYVLLFVFEIIVLGIPERSVEIQRGYAKGFLLEIFIYIIPWVYIGVKVLLTSLLIKFLKVLNSKPN